MGLISIRVGDVDVKLIETFDRVAARVRRGEQYEPKTLDRWAALCGIGGTVIDVGAYTGLFTIAARLMGNKTVAVEPMPTCVQRFKENCRRNGVMTAVVQAAASDENSMAAMHFSGVILTSGASMSPLPKEAGSINVQTVTIDSMNLEEVSAIKIDAERAEARVLRGAALTLSRCRPKLLVEVLDESSARAVRAAVPEYRLVEQLERNWYMEAA